MAVTSSSGISTTRSSEFRGSGPGWEADGLLFRPERFQLRPRAAEPGLGGWRFDSATTPASPSRQGSFTSIEGDDGRFVNGPPGLSVICACQTGAPGTDEAVAPSPGAHDPPDVAP
jgi:hypothetical protein